MTRAVQAASEWALDDYKLTRLFSMVFSHNVGSIRVLEKAGFQREGIMRRSAIKNGSDSGPGAVCQGEIAVSRFKFFQATA